MSLDLANSAAVPSLTAEGLFGAPLLPKQPEPKRLLRKLAMSTVVWILYVPHLAVLKMLGPRLAPAWARCIGRIHWLLTPFGAQRHVREILEKVHAELRTNLSVPAILRKHLEMKHECFARVRLFNKPNTSSRAHTLTWEIQPELLEKFRHLMTSGQGIIFVGYHFGFFRLSATEMPNVLQGCNPVYVAHRMAHYAGETIEQVAELALQRALDADRQSNAPIHYLTKASSPLGLVRLLRGGGSIAIAADGAFTTDFVDVPFLGRKLRVACGWARLAAKTNSKVLILLDVEIDAHRRRVELFDHVQLNGDSSEEAISGALAEATRIFENFVRQQPWAWHPWQRLRCELASDGSEVLVLSELGSERRVDGPPNIAAASMQTRLHQSYPAGDGAQAGSLHVPASASSTTRGPGSRPVADSRPRMLRVAVVTNSLTPYRIHLHEKIVSAFPDIELWSLATHKNAFRRWEHLEPPADIRPVEFSNGEPTDQQTKLRYSAREWRKGGQIIRWLKEHQVAAVFCQGSGDLGRLRILRWCHRQKIPCFLTGDCNVRGDRIRGWRRLLKHVVFRRAVAWSYGVMPCGVYGRRFFERYGAVRKPIFYFPYLPDVELFEAPPRDSVEQWKSRLGAKGPRKRLLFSARMMPVKRPDLVIEAFGAIASKRPDWDLVMAGDGLLREELQSRLAAGIKDRVLWTGFVHQPRELAGLYANCDALVLPSDHEPWGVVLVEAAAAGLAIIASDVVGASPELVRHDRNGIVFPAGELKALIRAIEHVTSAEHLERMQAASPVVLREWLAYADPVTSFRNALTTCGVLSESAPT